MVSLQGLISAPALSMSVAKDPVAEISCHTCVLSKAQNPISQFQKIH